MDKVRLILIKTMKRITTEFTEYMKENDINQDDLNYGVRLVRLRDLSNKEIADRILTMHSKNGKKSL